MDRLYRTLALFAKVRRRHEDDFVDRMHHEYTFLMLITFSIMVTTRQYVGEPISCWTPAHFTSGQQKYTNNICWVKNTYWRPLTEPLPQDQPHQINQEISYYQYVPFLLLIQATLFQCSSILWSNFNNRSGISLQSITEVASVEMENLDPRQRERLLKNLVRYVELCLENQREYRSNWRVRLKQKLAQHFCLCWGKRYGNFLAMLYMCTKLANLANVIVQLMLFNPVLGSDLKFYGFEMLIMLITGYSNSSTRESPRFPRETMCDFEVRRVGQTHRYSVQCVLPVNLFHEKLFLFLWFWLVFLAAITTVNIAIWLDRLLLKKEAFVGSYLRVGEVYEGAHKKFLHRFVESYLRYDGILLLQLIRINSGEQVVLQLVKLLWVNYKARINKALHEGEDEEENNNT